MRVHNYFINAKIDSDTAYPFQDGKGYVLAENMRITGNGEDGRFVSLKGSELVSDEFTDDGSVIIGAYEGRNNKMYYALAHPDKTSKIVEYDTETKTSKLIIQDSQYLRFDLIRWETGTEIFPYKYLLSINQVGDLLIFSNEVWRYPRMINITRAEDYQNGFTEEDIILVKKPPKLAPEIELIDDSNIVDEESSNKFMSFAYRYKYIDGDYSALSFYSDVGFQTEINFKINSLRLNESMVNKFNKITVKVNSGNKNVTDVEVYAREHGSNTVYLIRNINKKSDNIADNSEIDDIDYYFSNKYPVLEEQTTLMLYSNCPMFPKAQENVGNRMFWGNFIEGFDLIDKNGNPVKIDYTAHKIQNPNGNKTAISLFRYLVSVIFYNDYNISTTALIPSNRNDAEIETTFLDRLHNNKIRIEFPSGFKAPAFATKMKFAVKSDVLNYENIYSEFVTKIGDIFYIYLSKDNINKLKVGDYFHLIGNKIIEYKEFRVEEIKQIKKEELDIGEEGTFAIVHGFKDVDIFKNPGGDGETSRVTAKRYVNESSDPNSGEESDLTDIWGKIGNTTFGTIYPNDKVTVTFELNFERTVTKDIVLVGVGAQDGEQLGYFSKEYSYISGDEYDNVIEFISNNLDNSNETLFNFDYTNTNQMNVVTNQQFHNWFRNNQPGLLSRANTTGIRITCYFRIKITLRRGNEASFLRTKNKEQVDNQLYYETDKTYLIDNNGQPIPDSTDQSGNLLFDINFYNGYCWGNGVESYKIRDEFNGKALNNNLRQNAYDINGYKARQKKNDITWSGLYNEEMNINQLSTFNPALANWKTITQKYGEIGRLLSSDNNLTAYTTNKVVLLMYEKSILYDVTGTDQVALSNDVLGAEYVLDYEYGIGNNPESVVSAQNIHYFIDPVRKRFLIKSGREIQEINGRGSGFFNEGIKLLSEHKSFLGCYNDNFAEYVVGFDHLHSVAFSLENKGFTSYFKNNFEYLIGMNGQFFTAHNGTLYQNEASENAENANDFAGQGKFAAKIKFVIVPEPDKDKFFKTIFLHTNTGWNTEIKTNLNATKFSEKTYEKEESFFYTDIYRDNTTNKNIKGVGNIKSVSGNTLTFNHKLGVEIMSGDVLTDETGNQSVIESVSGNTIIVENASVFSIGDYTYTQPQEINGFRPNGGVMRGQWMEVTLTKIPQEKIYISAATTEVVESK
ncbi:MAG: hypothetical protein LBE36_06695 [Flavobacteriaceae bacterium]|jgi:hypothetical protein|nr:hypothetical protein [Flavobacteriaceae bacterium]